MTADEIEELRIIIGEFAGANAPGAAANPVVAELRQALMLLGGVSPDPVEA